jgi:hypothetical protein
MSQIIIIPEKPAPPQITATEGEFAFRSGAEIAARRSLLRMGHGASDTLLPDYFQSTFAIPVGEAKMIPEFSREFQAARQEKFEAHVSTLQVFVWGNGVEPLGNETESFMVVNDKLKSIFKKPGSADKKYGGFLHLFAQDIGASAYEADWQNAAVQKPELLRMGNDVLPIDGLAARVNYAYGRNPGEAQRRAIHNSRLRGEKFVERHGETVNAAVEAFPQLAKQVLTDLGITDESTLAAVAKRIEEVRSRVVVTSYLEAAIPGDAHGVYYGSSHAAFINADLLVTASKEQVEHVVFHELWHAVSSQNNVDCREVGSDETIEKTMGTGIPQASWLTEGVTDILARRTIQKHYKDRVVTTGAYDDEVSIVTNIIEANPRIKALLFEGNFEDMSAAQTPSQLKTSRAVAMIEKVYGAGFVALTEKTLRNGYEEPDKQKSAQIAREVERLQDYTKEPKYAKKALKLAGLLTAAFVVYAHGTNGLHELEDYMGEVAESRMDAESPVVWHSTTPEEVRTIVDLNTYQGTDTKVGYAKGGFIQVSDNEGKAEHYFDPIYLKNQQGEEFVGYMKNGALIFQKLGRQPEGGQVMIAFPDEQNLVYGLTPIVRDGMLIDARSGEEIGDSATWEEIRERIEHDQ